MIEAFPNVSYIIIGSKERLSRVKAYAGYVYSNSGKRAAAYLYNPNGIKLASLVGDKVIG